MASSSTRTIIPQWTQQAANQLLRLTALGHQLMHSSGGKQMQGLKKQFNSITLLHKGQKREKSSLEEHYSKVRAK
jgi:hypothetical protein